MNPTNITTANYPINTATPQRVIPLLQTLHEIEEVTSALAVRLDPITNHVPSQAPANPTANTVTQRLHQVGDALQYLLDNIEL